MISKKIISSIYIWSLGFYGYVMLILGLRGLFLSYGLNEALAFFCASCIAVFLRIAYEHRIVFKASIESVDYIKVIAFVFVNAVVFAALAHFLRGPLGGWAVFAVIGIGQRVMDILKQNSAWLAHAHEYRATDEALSHKIKTYVDGLYWFFGILAGLAYFGVKHAGQKMFFPIFAGALFVALVYSIIFEVQSVYEQKITLAHWFAIGALALIFACATTGLMFGLMFGAGLSGKTISIVGVVTVKLIQPLITNRLFVKW